jgi:hypothetical protein
MSAKQNHGPTYFLVAINRFRLPKPFDTGESVDANRPEPAEFGVQLARFDSRPRGKTVPPLPDDPPTVLWINYYHHVPMIRDDYWHTGEMITTRIVDGMRSWAGTFSVQSPVDLMAMWAMATIYLEHGRRVFASYSDLKKHLGEFEPDEIELALPFGITPSWRLSLTDRTSLYLVIPKIREDDQFPREDSLAMAHYALLKILEQRYNKKVREQLGEPSDHAGEAAKRIMSASSFLHR